MKAFLIENEKLLTKCPTCDDNKKLRYFITNDDVYVIDCPTCNNGSQKDYEHYEKLLRA